MEASWTNTALNIGKTLLCGYARIGGWSVGIVANQKMHVHTLAPGSGEKRIEFGGVIYTESADKAARFILDCNQNLIPLIFLHDVNGFMVGKEAEWSGIIRAGAKMVNAVSNSVVPKITVICGGSFGAGHYAMCGKAYDPRFIFAWPTARYAVMSGDSAAGTLVEIKIKQLEREGKKLREKEKKELLRIGARHLRTANRPALRRRAAMGGRDHRSRAHARSADLGSGCRCAESGSPRVQNRRSANLNNDRKPKTEISTSQPWTPVKIIECPRDAWQGLPQIIPTEEKIEYLRELLKAGFRHSMR